ncbi:MAG: LysR family transcriptional regulator [Rhodopseudomonas sp.]|nr:LysR family transcriptional regulator [Rhodopseudomonas sp.]
MKLDPRHLVQLAAILDSGTLRQAAERLGTTQPALSRTIAMMEERVGTPLFERSRRPLTPTDTGLELAAFGRTIQGAVERADMVSQQITAGEYGSIRLGAPPFFCDQLLSRIVGKFALTHPQVRVVLHADYFPALVKEILNHKLDIVMGPFELLERQSTLDVERLIQNRNVIICRPGHRLARQKKVTTADLAAATWVGHARESMLSADMKSTLADLGVDQLNIVFESNSAGALLTMVQDSDCLSVLPLLSVVHRIEAGELMPLPVVTTNRGRWTGIITPADGGQSAAMLALRKVLARDIIAVVPLMNKIVGQPHSRE